MADGVYTRHCHTARLLPSARAPPWRPPPGPSTLTRPTCACRLSSPRTRTWATPFRMHGLFLGRRSMAWWMSRRCRLACLVTGVERGSRCRFCCSLCGGCCGATTLLLPVAGRQASLAAVTAMATLEDVCPHHLDGKRGGSQDAGSHRKRRCARDVS
jgi:hypothetical protein